MHTHTNTHSNIRKNTSVTNFTTLAGDFRRRGVRRVLVVTSDWHLPRAVGVGKVILGEAKNWMETEVAFACTHHLFTPTLSLVPLLRRRMACV